MSSNCWPRQKNKPKTNAEKKGMIARV
jgi:hypothetical protein